MSSNIEELSSESAIEVEGVSKGGAGGGVSSLPPKLSVL